MTDCDLDVKDDWTYLNDEEVRDTLKGLYDYPDAFLMKAHASGMWSSFDYLLMKIRELRQDKEFLAQCLKARVSL